MSAFRCLKYCTRIHSHCGIAILVQTLLVGAPVPSPFQESRKKPQFKLVGADTTSLNEVQRWSYSYRVSVYAVAHSMNAMHKAPRQKHRLSEQTISLEVLTDQAVRPRKDDWLKACSEERWSYAALNINTDTVLVDTTPIAGADWRH